MPSSASASHYSRGIPAFGSLTQRIGLPDASRTTALKGRWVRRACRLTAPRMPCSSSAMLEDWGYVSLTVGLRVSE